MKSGHINQFAHLSQFQSVTDFNNSTKRVLEIFEHRFTKGEKIALLKLIQFSVKVPGVSNARIAILVQSAQNEKGGVSRSTFERMIRKAKSLEIIDVHNTIREKGGYSHNVYVFQRFEGASPEQLTDRPTSKTPDIPSPQDIEKAPEANLFKTENIKDKELRTPSLEQLDVSFVPSHVPTLFIKTVKPFFNRATEVCDLWDRAVMIYRSLRFDDPIEYLLPIIIQAFKETVYRYKQRQIKNTFIGYFYGTARTMLVHEKMRYSARQGGLAKWLEKEEEEEWPLSN